MGIVAFQWENNQLLLLQNRDNFDHLKIKPAAWDEDDKILRGWLEPEGGTWFGISRTGRVAFLVDGMFSTGLNRYVLFPLDFLQGEMSPEEFAKQMCQDPLLRDGMASYHLIVADITSNSMCHIYKVAANMPLVASEDVGFGVHVLSTSGLDSESAKPLRMRGFFDEMIGDYRNKDLPPLKDIAAKFMYDPQESQQDYTPGAFFVDITMTKVKELSNHEKCIEDSRYRTTSTTALHVKPTKQVKLYERYLEDGQWKDHDFKFNIA